MTMKDTMLLMSRYSTDIHETDHKEPIAKAVRAYHSSPGMMSLQIRNYGSITGRSSGKERNMIATAQMNLAQVAELRDLLNVFIEENF